MTGSIRLGDTFFGQGAVQHPVPGGWGRTKAPFACDPLQSRGRLVAEPESGTRSVFMRDRDRIVHSAAFRRLKYKTQVFVYHEGDAFRTRLTHTLEVAQIARSISRVLGVEEDLAEALALAHDLGHPPFGHAGEDALQKCMDQFGGFDHNAQTLRVVTKLEQRYANFDGLNLTWETLEGLVKHNGPVTDGPDAPLTGLPAGLRAFEAASALDLHSYASAEAQVAALADDIAYNNHDIDDGVRAGLFSLNDLRGLPLVGDVIAEVDTAHPGIDPQRQVHEVNRRLIQFMVDDLIAETRRRVEAATPDSPAAVRALGHPLVAFSGDMLDYDRALRDFLFTRMYRHFRVNRMMSKAKRVIGELFELFLAEPEILPEAWQTHCDGAGGPATARAICDYIAGMTDRFAMAEHRRLFSLDGLS